MRNANRQIGYLSAAEHQFFFPFTIIMEAIKRTTPATHAAPAKFFIARYAKSNMGAPSKNVETKKREFYVKFAKYSLKYQCIMDST